MMEGTSARRKGQSPVPECAGAFMLRGGPDGRISERLMRESHEEMYIKAGQVKWVEIHSTFFKILGARNNSAFRICQLLNRL